MHSLHRIGNKGSKGSKGLVELITNKQRIRNQLKMPHRNQNSLQNKQTHTPHAPQ